jgi:hypothetical protein
VAARKAVPRVRAWGRWNGTCRRKVPRAREAVSVGAKAVERVLVLLGSPLGGELAGTTWGACGRPSGPVEVENTEMGRGSGDRITREAVGMATAGTHGVNRGATQGR